MNAITTETIRKSDDNVADSTIGAQAVTLGTALPKISRALYIGVAGNLMLTFADGTTVLHKNLVSGMLYPFAVKLVATAATGADATDVVAHF